MFATDWIVFFACSDWLLTLGIVSAIHLPAFSSGFRARGSFLIPQKKGPTLCSYCKLCHYFLFCAGYPPVWYILKQSFTSESVKSSRFVLRGFAALQVSTALFTSTSVSQRVVKYRLYRLVSEIDFYRVFTSERGTHPYHTYPKGLVRFLHREKQE